jgi:capsular polysaccharide biosynthesis protein
MALEEAAQDTGHPVAYFEMASALRSPPPPPAFIFGPLPAYLAPALFSDFEIPAAGCYHLQDVQVTFDAIILLQGKPVWSLGLNQPPLHVPEVLARNVPGFDRLPVRRIRGRAAIIHGPGYNVFGHWLIDFLPRLYVLRRAGYDIEKLKIILPSSVEAFGPEFLRRIGIPADNIVWHDHRAELLQPDELIAPTVLRQRSRFSPLLAVATQYWLERVCDPAGPRPWAKKGRRLFISRSQHPSNRGLKTRAAIEQRAAQAGYEIVHPERLALPEQIQLLRSAGRIMGEYGSGLHAAIYAPAGTAVCALRGTSNHPGFAQSGLAEVFGHHLGYVFAETPQFAEDQVLDIDIKTFDMALAAMEMWGPNV